MNIWIKCTACGFKQYANTDSVHIEGTCPNCGVKGKNRVEMGTKNPPSWWDEDHRPLLELNILPKGN